MWNFIWGVIVILFVFWLMGFIFHIAGGLVHVLLIVILILIIWNLFQLGRKKHK